LRSFRRQVSGALLTYLVEPDDAGLHDAPLLQRAARHWLAALSTRVRHCIVCSSWIANRQDVGALLMSTPVIVKPTSVGTAAICRECWEAELPTEALVRACYRRHVRAVVSSIRIGAQHERGRR
jgi:hypothetical protein